MALSPRPSSVRRSVSVASKTFFVGEYAALQGGPSLIAATSPRFSATFHCSADFEKSSAFHADSPAGRLWTSLGLRRWSTQWIDPHRGRGGFGASTAQFAAVLALSDHEGAKTDLLGRRDWNAILRLYRECAWSGEGLAPSGADLVAQIKGRFCAFDGRANVATSADWPFAELDFALVRTGTKLATHDHLKESAAALAPVDQLQLVATAAISALSAGDAPSFCAAIASYGALLASAGLVAEQTKHILKSAWAALGSELLAAKGCGAMGADVILFVFSKVASARVDAFLAKEKLTRVASKDDLTEGILFDTGAV